MTDFIRLDTADNVITATAPLEAGAALEKVVTTGLVPRSHKVAAELISAGDAIRKYAQIIGYASEDIPAGAHVHTHNVEFRNVEGAYEFGTDLRLSLIHI